MNDAVWAAVRYALIALGTYGATKGWFSADQVGPTIDALQGPIGAIISAGSAMWGLWISLGTKRVPLTTAQRADVPTVNPVTKQTIPSRVRDHL